MDQHHNPLVSEAVPVQYAPKDFGYETRLGKHGFLTTYIDANRRKASQIDELMSVSKCEKVPRHIMKEIPPSLPILCTYAAPGILLNSTILTDK